MIVWSMNKHAAQTLRRIDRRLASSMHQPDELMADADEYLDREFEFDPGTFGLLGPAIYSNVLSSLIARREYFDGDTEAAFEDMFRFRSIYEIDNLEFFDWLEEEQAKEYGFTLP